MSRSKLLHVPDGYYYVRMSANGGQKIIYDESDLSALENVIEAALRRTQACAHAYCITDTDVRLAVQIGDVPVSQLVQFISGPYAGRLHRRRKERGTLFQRNRTAFIANDAYLLKVVRHIHRECENTKRMGERIRLWRSSHAAYCGKAEIPWLTTSAVLALLRQNVGEGRKAYRKFMMEAVRAEERALIDSAARCIPLSTERHPPLMADVHGKRALAEKLDPLIAAVAEWFGVTSAQLLSRSRSQYLTCARALVAWHATRSGMASVEEVARRFRRNRSSLSAALARYSVAWPSIFNQPIGQLLTHGPTPPNTLRKSFNSIRAAA